MADVQALIARHFWRDGEYAVWQANELFPASLLAWLKGNYAELVAGSRLNWIERPEGLVYLFFSDERETHGRMATRLTACWIKEKVVSANDVYRQLKQVGDLTHDHSLSIPINTLIIKQQRTVVTTIIFGCLLLIAVAVYWFSGNTEIPHLEQSIDTTESDDPDLGKAHEYAAIVQQRPISAKQNVCNLIEIKYCFQYFISERCSHLTNIAYDDWLQGLKKHNLSGFKNRSCPQNLQNDADLKSMKETLSAGQVELLRNFLKQSGSLQ